jgi:hypothetical protein
VEELGCELRLRSDDVRAPLQAIIYLTEEPLTTSPPKPAAPEIKTTA